SWRRDPGATCGSFPHNGGKKGRFPGESTKETVKPLRGASRDVSAVPVKAVCVLRYHCTRCCGRSRRPAFPAPSLKTGADEVAKLGQIMPRDRWFTSACARILRLELPHCLSHIRRGTAAEACMASRVDFTSQNYFRNPAAALEQLRHQGPVVDVSFPIIGRVWATTTQALADRVLKDTETFTIRKDDGEVAGMRWWMPGIIKTFATSMLSMDEPDHKRLRDIVDEAFRRRAVLLMEPHIEATAEQLANDLFAEASPADLIERYARKLPLSVICELLGLPLADRPKFSAWANTVARLTGVVSVVRMIASIYAMKRYLARRLQVARADGGEGLIAELVR